MLNAAGMMTASSPSCPLPQDRSAWTIWSGLHRGPQHRAAWRGPSSYHVRPPAPPPSGGGSQRWLGTRSLTGPQDFQSLGASGCFHLVLLYSNYYSKKPLFSTTPIQSIQWTTLPLSSRSWFLLNNYRACDKWFMQLCRNRLSLSLCRRGRRMTLKYDCWLCVGQRMCISTWEVHVFKMLLVCVRVPKNLKRVDAEQCFACASSPERGWKAAFYCWPRSPCCTKPLHTLYKKMVSSFVL